MCAFSTSLTTTVFSQRSMWRFETVPHRTIPEGQQSSIFHRALIPPSDCLPTTRFLIRGALKGAINMPHYLISVWHDETFELDFSTPCLLYTSDAADEEDSVDLGGRRIIKKKKKNK